ncbi:ornithine carbamoyltransferase [Brevibacillus laterosporus]|uniref:Ornithine carbamoyltransferase n=1 Tax=Brevibacillus laterosporus TaxID=1465 RepID=A0A502II04_BRELA|nr:ornithine carbamoyltransferase [Brevibacillus laterosporus]QDX91557.1 ornithine carbamoyltransferase [Brevibacillus laterosporus]TPG85774.1 ornithine carbamoyltransferase [Brevibacillus laterosporus]
MKPVKTLDLYADIQLSHYKGKSTLQIDEWNREEILGLLHYASQIKAMQKSGKVYQPLAGKTLAMIFTKSSTRTRVSFEVGMYQLGGSSLFLTDKDLQLGRGETISDTAKILSSYVDGIMIRTHAHEDVIELAKHASVPVINGLTDLYHPCQALADLLTIQEHKGKLQGMKLAFIGDGNNVANSLVLAAVILGLDVRVATPPGYEMQEAIVQKAQEYAVQYGGKFLMTHDASVAVDQADVIYTDVWTSMGFEEENEQRLKDFAAYQVNKALVAKADSAYIFMHCLPVHRGEEVTAEIIDGPHSVVFEEAENRLHAQKALLASVM